MDDLQLDLDLDLDFGGSADFDVELDLDNFGTILDNDGIESRYIKPAIKKNTLIKYEHAQEMAMNIGLGKGERTFAIVSGAFIFGDFIEALLDSRNLVADEIYLTTLSMSENNVDSLVNIMEAGRCNKLDLMISAYFFSHERHNLVPYIYDQLDRDDKFQLSVCGTHCKMALIKCQDKYYVMHGSANLRSSNNLEQFEFEESEELYNFNREYFEEIAERYQTIKKPLRGNAVWQVVANQENPTKQIKKPERENQAQQRLEEVQQSLKEVHRR